VAGGARVRGPRVAPLAGDLGRAVAVAIISARDRLGGDVSGGRVSHAFATRS
jgi:hypothetical protein